MSTPKAEVTSMLAGLPDDSSFEDIQYHLYVLEKVKRGVERARGRGCRIARGRQGSPEQMARRLVWSLEAIEDIESIASYIERDSS